MKYERHVPSPPLSGLIDYLWQISDAPAHARERILPNGSLELVINLVEDEIRIYDGATSEPRQRLSGAVVSGVFSRFFVIDTREHAQMIGVHFKPGGAFPFLRGLPALELANAHVDLPALWGNGALALRQRLLQATTSEQRFQLLEAALRAELCASWRSHRAVPPAIQAFGSTNMSIAGFAAHANLSHRRLIELFTREVGATPKLFQRLRRFQRTLALARSSDGGVGTHRADVEACSWAELAGRTGYCDQSHWIRDCLTFSGLTPAQYATEWTEQVKDDHLPLIVA